MMNNYLDILADPNASRADQLAAVLTADIRTHAATTRTVLDADLVDILDIVDRVVHNLVTD